MHGANGEVCVNVNEALPCAELVESKSTVALNESLGFPTPMIDTTKPAEETVGGEL